MRSINNLLVGLTYIYKAIMEVKTKQRSSHSNLFIYCIKNFSSNYCKKIRALCPVKIWGELRSHRFSHTQNEETHKPKTCNSST